MEWELVPTLFSLRAACFMNAEFIAMLDYLERERGIKREILLEAVSNALLSASKKSVGASRELRIDINPIKFEDHRRRRYGATFAAERSVFGNAA